MPKQLYKITQFHGGLNSNSDARDIAENELSEATDVMVDELGKIRMMGGTTAQGTAARANAITPGYGLAQFSHDRVDGHTSSADSADEETGADYFAFSDSDTTGKISIYSAEDTIWDEPITGLTNNDSSTGQRKDVFYIVDGALRVCDSEFRNDNDVKWYGYIKRTHFDDVATPDSYDEWNLFDAKIAAPTRGICGVLGRHVALNSSTDVIVNIASGNIKVFQTVWDGEIDASAGHYIVNESAHKFKQVGTMVSATQLTTGTLEEGGDGDVYDGDSFNIFPPIGTGFNISIYSEDVGAVGSTIEAAEYALGTTFIYDAEPGEPLAQESIIYQLTGVTVPESSANQYFSWQPLLTGPYNPRITGGRVYIKGTTTASYNNPEPIWKMLGEISLKHGYRSELNDAYTPWAYYDTSASAIFKGGYNTAEDSSHLEIMAISSITYEFSSGLSESDISTEAKFKTVAVANRIAYIGNVQKDGISYGDAVIKSPVNRFDIFPKSRMIEASVRDGDSIIKLEAYADRLLIFKKNKLELLNISQEVEFLEDTFLHKGVSHHAASCKTDFGIAWVNRRGCYLYDGQKVNDLLEKQGRQIIKESDWASFTTDNSIIGYIPKKRQIIVLKDCTATSTGDIYLFDIVTKSWVKGDSKFTDNQIQTNFVTDWNGDLVNAHTSETGTIEKWDDAGDDSTAFVIQTKDIDFGQPAQKKKVYKVYVTYTGVGSLDVDVEYRTNGDGGWTAVQSGSTLDQTSGQNEATLTLSTPVECYSFQLRFSGTGKTAFEINDATIVFRLKGQR